MGDVVGIDELLEISDNLVELQKVKSRVETTHVYDKIKMGYFIFLKIHKRGNLSNM